MATTGSDRPERQIMDAQEIQRSLSRIAHEILERNRGVDDLVLVGIYTRGVILSQRLGENIQRFEGSRAALAELGYQPVPGDLQAQGNPGCGPQSFRWMSRASGWFWWTMCSSRAGPYARHWTR